ncbi:MAG: hypothetical protein DBY16_09970 [Coprobacter sp.]|nr:MAG: hypothetical protein DBY16_09970 [Coprobacter sp.]
MILLLSVHNKYIFIKHLHEQRDNFLPFSRKSLNFLRKGTKNVIKTDTLYPRNMILTHFSGILNRVTRQLQSK